MKIFLSLLSVSLSVVLGAENFAVTSLIGFEQFYVRLKEFRQPVEHFENETSKIKADICTAIMRNTFFSEHQHLDPVNPHDEAIQEELKHVHGEHFRYHSSDGTSSSKQRYEFVNSYVPYDVIINELVFRERAFLCLARNGGSKNIERYFISPEYDVNESTRKGAEKLMGRFVFANKDPKKIVPIALAEEAAQRLKHEAGSVEHIFQDEFREETIESEARLTRSRAICDLSTLQKVRLCTLILNTVEHRENVKPVPEPKCVLKEIHFEHYTELHYEDDDDDEYSEWWESASPIAEWMLTCESVKVGINGSSIHYVSQGFSDNNFFVSKQLEGNATALNSIVSRVSVVPKIHHF